MYVHTYARTYAGTQVRRHALTNNRALDAGPPAARRQSRSRQAVRRRAEGRAARRLETGGVERHPEEDQEASSPPSHPGTAAGRVLRDSLYLAFSERAGLPSPCRSPREQECRPRGEERRVPSWIRGLGAAGDLSDQQLQVPPCRCPLLGSSPQEWLPAASRHPGASSSCFQIMREGPEQRPGRNGPALLSLCSSGCQPWPPAWPLPPSAARGSCSLPAPVTAPHIPGMPPPAPWGLVSSSL
ncbi:uncharacterized protein LOC132357220 [Balaenoptera ricei]|uniref:uncharacterized protein LOC132357220 n=1 Tax=Balaenoptera ricei TaxID=2746895 RepID=UPI0028BD7575|nr:uncharacterized protein LOC132357220 [Balaenoptera ricei]